MTQISVPRRLAEQPWISRIRLFRMLIIRVSRKPIAPIAANSGEALYCMQPRCACQGAPLRRYAF